MSKVIYTVSNLRKTFVHASKEVAHYFPMHMSRGLQDMQKTLKKVDCIIEVHDARIPLSGRNPSFRHTLMVRPHIMILNKIDLSNMKYHKVVAEIYRREGVQTLFYTNCREEVDLVVKKKLIPAALELVKDHCRYHRADEEDINLLVIGIPNVGKSSLINALRRVHLKKGKATPVGATPGVTKSVMEKIKVNDHPKMYVYDTPGIMVPKVPNMDVGMKLAVCGTLKDYLVGEDVIVDYLLYWMNKHSHFKYIQQYSLEQPTDNVLELLTHVAKQHNLVQKLRSPAGSYVFRPNFIRAAQIVLKDFRECKLGKINFDVDVLEDYQNQNKIT